MARRSWLAAFQKAACSHEGGGSQELTRPSTAEPAPGTGRRSQVPYHGPGPANRELAARIGGGVEGPQAITRGEPGGSSVPRARQGQHHECRGRGIAGGGVAVEGARREYVECGACFVFSAFARRYRVWGDKHTRCVHFETSRGLD